MGLKVFLEVGIEFYGNIKAAKPVFEAKQSADFSQIPTLRSLPRASGWTSILANKPTNGLRKAKGQLHATTASRITSRLTKPERLKKRPGGCFCREFQARIRPNACPGPLRFGVLKGASSLPRRVPSFLEA